MDKRILAVVMLLASLAVFLVAPSLDEDMSLPALSSNTTVADSEQTTPAETTTLSTSTPTSAETTAATSNDSTINSETSETSPNEETSVETSSAESSPPEVVHIPSGTPVTEHGQLKVDGRNIVDKNGDIFQLRGMSTHGITWFPNIISESAFKTLRDDWNVNSIRLAMYVDENGNSQCYMKNPEQSKALMIKGVDICTSLGLYAVIDWHVLNPGDPSKYTEAAAEFFDEMSTKYADNPNVIYEICNEPNGTTVKWDTVIKPYCEDIIGVIRANDPDAIIIAGSGTWSQDIHDILDSRLEAENVVYALHYYADSHKKKFRDRLEKCYNEGLPILVSEFGNCNASGNGTNNLIEASQWLTLLDELQIGYYNWNLADKAEASSVFKPGTDLSSGNWPDSALTESGQFIKQWYTGG